MTTFKDRHGEPVADDSAEPFIYHGEELTDERADAVAEDTVAEVRKRNLIPGGKSLSGDDTVSPTVQFRVSVAVKRKLEDRAAELGISVTKVDRHALEEYLAEK